MQEIFSLATKYSGFLLLFIVFGIALFSFFSRCRNRNKTRSNYKEKKFSKRILPQKKSSVRNIDKNSRSVAVNMPPETKHKTLISDSESSYDQDTSEDENNIEDDSFGHCLRADCVRVQYVENYAQTDDLEKDASIQADIIPKVLFNSHLRKTVAKVESSQEEDPKMEYWNESYQDAVEGKYMDDSDKDYESCVSFVSTRSRFDEATFNEVLALQSSSQRYEVNDVGCLEERAYRISRWLDDGERSTRSNNYHRNLSPVRIHSFSGISNAKIKYDRRPRFYSDDFSEVNREFKWEDWRDAPPVRKAYQEHFVAPQNYRISDPSKDIYNVRKHGIREIEYPLKVEKNNICINTREYMKYATPDIRKHEYDRMYGVQRERAMENSDRILENSNRNRFSGMREMKNCAEQQNHESEGQQNKIWNAYKNTSRIPDRRMESDEQHTTFTLQPRKDYVYGQKDRFQNINCCEENCAHQMQYQKCADFECKNPRKSHLTGNRFEGRKFETPNRRSNNVEVYHHNQHIDTENNHYNNYADRSEKKVVLLRRHNDGYSCDHSSSKRETYKEAIPQEKYKFSLPKNERQFIKHDDTRMYPKNFAEKSPVQEPGNVSRPVPAREKKRLSNYLKHQFNTLDDDTLRKSFRMVQDLKETLKKRGDTKLH